MNMVSYPFKELKGSKEVVDLYFGKNVFGYFYDGKYRKLTLDQEVRKEILEYLEEFSRILEPEIEYVKRLIKKQNIVKQDLLNPFYINCFLFDLIKEKIKRDLERGNIWEFFAALNTFFRYSISLNVNFAAIRGSLWNKLEEIYNGILNSMGKVFYFDIKDEELILIPATPMLNFPFHLIKKEKRFLYEEKYVTYLPHPDFYRFLKDKKIEGEENVVVHCRKCEVPHCENYNIELRYAEDEAEIVSKILGGNTIKIGRPNVNDLLKYSGKIRILHIASHCSADLRNVLNSKICLRKEHLYPVHFFKLKPSGLVFLSACQTGVHEARMMDSLGLHTAILASGAKVIVSTLWELNDASAAEFAEKFYSECKNKSVYEGYREAMNYIWNNYGSILLLPYCLYGLPHSRI